MSGQALKSRGWRPGILVEDRDPFGAREIGARSRHGESVSTAIRASGQRWCIRSRVTVSMARSPLLRNQYSLFSTRMRSGRVASVGYCCGASCSLIRRPSLLVADRSGLSHVIVGSTAVVAASMRIPSASFASTLPRMAIPDHVVDTVLVDLPMGDGAHRLPRSPHRRPDVVPSPIVYMTRQPQSVIPRSSLVSTICAQ